MHFFLSFLHACCVFLVRLVICVCFLFSRLHISLFRILLCFLYLLSRQTHSFGFRIRFFRIFSFLYFIFWSQDLQSVLLFAWESFSSQSRSWNARSAVILVHFYFNRDLIQHFESNTLLIWIWFVCAFVRDRKNASAIKACRLVDIPFAHYAVSMVQRSHSPLLPESFLSTLPRHDCSAWAKCPLGSCK